MSYYSLIYKFFSSYKFLVKSFVLAELRIVLDTIEIDEETDKHNDSTVDEFFTSLMKMVPKHAMAKIEENDVVSFDA